MTRAVAERPKYDWPAIRLEYVQGIARPDGSIWWPSTRELAERHSMPGDTVKNRCTNKKWRKAREAFQAQTSEAAAEVVIESRLARRLSESDKIFESAFILRQATRAQIIRTAQAIQSGMEAIPKDLVDLGRALQVIQDVMDRETYGPNTGQGKPDAGEADGEATEYLERVMDLDEAEFERVVGALELPAVQGSPAGV